METGRTMGAGLLLFVLSCWPVDSMDHHPDAKGNYTNPTQDPGSNYSKVACDFSHDSCGWKNVGGDDYPLKWERKSDSYMRLKMKGAGNRKGRLASPWLPPLADHRCQLRFRYYIEFLLVGSPKCQLSLFRQTWSGEEQQLWVTRKGTGYRDFSGLIDQAVNCTAERFRMVFQGWKECSWRVYYKETDVKSIQFIVYPDDVHPPTHTPDLRPEVFTIERVSTDPDHGATTEPQVNNNNNNQSHLDDGALAGIIATAVIVIVIVGVVVIVIVRRRRRRQQSDKGKKDSTSRKGSGTVTNSAYMMVTEQITGNSATNSRGHHPDVPTGDNYEVVDLPPPPYADIAPTPHTNDTIPSHQPILSPNSPQRSCPPTHQDPPEGHIDRRPGQRSSSQSQPLRQALATASDSIPEDTYHHTNATAASRCPAVSDDTYDHTNGSTVPSVSERNLHDADNNDYNKLHLRSTRPAAAVSPSDDTYDHAHVPAQHPRWSSEDSDQPQPQTAAKRPPNDQHQSTKPEDAAAIFAQAGTSHYETVPGDVGQNVRSSPEEGDVYNRLDVTGERRRREEGVGENVYDNAKDDDYDSLHEENKRRRQQRQLARDDYSHL